MSPESAQELLLERGRGYVYKGKYPQVVVFTTSLVDIYKLKAMYGGRHYQHNTGYVWVLAKKHLLLLMLDSLKACKSRNGFEVMLRRHYEKMH